MTVIRAPRHSPDLGPVRRLATAAELVTASADDVFVRCELRADADGGLLGPAWAAPGAPVPTVVFSRRSTEAGHQRLTALGPPAPAAALLAVAVTELPQPPAAITVPRGVAEALPEPLKPRDAEDWDWFWTAAPPHAVPGEERVGLLEAGATTDAELRELLPRWSTSYSAEPGAAYVRHWGGVRDDSGRLLAVGAHVEYVPGVPHLASIATAPEARGRGLGTGVTASLTRRAVAERGICTLGMYAHNDVARRLYRRLGYTDSHHWTSGALATA